MGGIQEEIQRCNLPDDLWLDRGAECSRSSDPRIAGALCNLTNEKCTIFSDFNNFSAESESRWRTRTAWSILPILQALHAMSTIFPAIIQIRGVSVSGSARRPRTPRRSKPPRLRLISKMVSGLGSSCRIARILKEENLQLNLLNLCYVQLLFSSDQIK